MPKDLISIEWERWDPFLQTVKVSSHISPVFGLGHGAGVCVSYPVSRIIRSRIIRISRVCRKSYGCIRAGNLKAERSLSSSLHATVSFTDYAQVQPNKF